MTRNDSLTFQEAAELLVLFYEANPSPEKSDFKFNSSLENTILVLKKLLEISKAPTDTPEFSKNITESLWFKRSSKGSPISWPQVINVTNDTLSFIQTVLFAAHAPGIVASTFVSSTKSILDRLEKRAEYDRRIHEAKNSERSEFQTVGDAIRQEMREDTERHDLDDVVAQVEKLSGLMSDMLRKDSPQPESVMTEGFDQGWIERNPSISKSYLLGPDNLGGVWLLVRSPAFEKLVLAGDFRLNQDITSTLTESASSTMITTGLYCYVITVVVAAIKLYATIRLLPDEAFHPKWKPFDKSNLISYCNHALIFDWNAPEPENYISDLSAKYCYNFLRDNLDPKASVNWLKRVDPSTGDAVGAYKKILDRLNRISNASNLPGCRDGYWFLPEDQEARVSPSDYLIQNLARYIQHGGSDKNWQEDIFNELKNRCLSNQSELKDTALTAAVRDDFINPFINFQTELKFNWILEEQATGVSGWIRTGIDMINPITAPGALTSLAAREAVITFLNQNYSSYKTPWKDSHSNQSGYNQVCWHSQCEYVDGGFRNITEDVPMLWQTAGWAGFILLNYADKFKFELDTELQMTTYKLSCIVHQALMDELDESIIMLTKGNELAGLIPSSKKDK